MERSSPDGLPAFPALRACPVLGLALGLVLALALAALPGCGPDPATRLQRVRPDFASGRTLAEAMKGYRCFSRVNWSSHGDPAAIPAARMTGIFNLECLVGAQSGGRLFTAREKNALDRAGANLCYVLEYAFPPERPEGVLTGAGMMIVTTDWTQDAPLTDDALSREIAENRLGERTVKAALDASDYARLRSQLPPRQ